MLSNAEQYREIKPKFERLKNNVVQVLQQLVEDKEIPIFSIESRVKDEKSFLEKVVRKKYASPFKEMDDLCGVRVICYYHEDIEKICRIVEDEFHVIQRENKREQLDDDQFGYASYHYVIDLKDEWLAHPSARGLEGLRVEIQIRTMLMHTWSAISHKLLYKRGSDVPSQFTRKLNRLSALIELADEQFDSMKNVKTIYREKLSESREGFDVLAELNSDSLIALRQYYFADRRYADGDIPILLDEVKSLGYNLKRIVDSIELCLPYLKDLETEEADYAETDLPMWGFTGTIRTVLDLVDDGYWETRQMNMPDYVRDAVNKHRSIMRQGKNSEF